MIVGRVVRTCDTVAFDSKDVLKDLHFNKLQDDNHVWLLTADIVELCPSIKKYALREALARILRVVYANQQLFAHVNTMCSILLNNTYVRIGTYICHKHES